MEFFIPGLVLASLFLAAAWVLDHFTGLWGVVPAAGLLTFFGLCANSPFLAGMGAMTFLLSLLSLPLLPFFETRPRMGFYAALGGVVLSAGLSLWMIQQALERMDRLAEAYPLVSLEERLAHERRAADAPHAPVELAAPVEQRIARRESEERSDYRGEALADLHSAARVRFALREGFGVGRMAGFGEWRIRLPESRAIPLPSGADESADPESGPLASAPRGADLPQDAELLELHTQGEETFLDPRRMGYVKSRAEVAGFVPHRFDHAPTGLGFRNTDEWQVTQLQLISLLRHKGPVAYVSDHLPDMSELAKFKTRPLDEFEDSALAKLRREEDLVLDEAPNRLRMVGSLRANQRCSECHEVPRGTLLGAFSYVLQRKNSPPPKPPAARQPSA